MSASDPQPGSDDSSKPSGEPLPYLLAEKRASIYLASIQLYLYRGAGTQAPQAEENARAIATYLATRPQPLEVYRDLGMPGERCAFYGIHLLEDTTRPDRYVLCTLIRGRWGRMKTNKVLSTHPSLQGAHAVLEARCGIIVELDRVEGSNPPHWVAYARSDPYR